MKNILILVLIFTLSLSLSGQRTLTINEVWTGTHIETDDVIVPNGIVLTIDPGAVVQFAAGKSLKITGSGSLLAGSLTGSVVTFTANDGISWGHLVFENTTTSYLRNCIIEKGDATALTPNYGGGIYAKTNRLSIDNCIIRNNKAPYGGGIFVDYYGNPSISNCYIYSNISTVAGGGLYFLQYTYSIVSNCVINNNICTGTTWGGGGVFLGSISGNVRFINCSIVSNTSINPARGNNIFFYQNIYTPKPSFYNSIVWGSDNSIYYQAQTAEAADFNYCAIQGYTTGYTSCINLSSTNGDPSGPNFIDPNISNYSIIFASPCRDAGMTPVPAIPYDLAGNSRIGRYDIGAYEVAFNRWKTTASSTDWSTPGNWDQGVPTSTQDIAIPAGATYYPTGSSSQDYTIGAGHGMVVDAGARVTLNALTNNGTLLLNSSSSGIASLILSSYTKGGGATEVVQLYLTGGYIGNPALRVGRWHYISSPFDPSTPLSISPFTANTYDLARWVDGIQSPASILLGFVAYDGFVYNDSDPADPGTFWGGTFSTLTTGKGYNFWDDLTSFNYSLTGKLNTADVPVTLDFAGAAYENGYNLLGNPFSSGLNWDDIINSVYFTYPSNTSKSLYFTRDNVSCSYIAGVGVPADVTGIIPPMQGFFTKTYSTGNVITLAAAARVNDNIHARYKGQTIIPLVRLEIDKDSLSRDETVVRFDDKALPTLDNEFDALKMFLSASNTSIYSSDGTSKYSINGQPFPATEVVIPVTINLQLTGNHKISTNQLQGLDNYNVTLKDNTTGFIADLKSTPEILFSAAAGTSSGRFVLKISTLITGIENPTVPNGIFNIYNGQDLLNIQTIADEWDGQSGSVRVMDLTGKTVADLYNAEFTKNSLVQVQSPAAKGLYVVEIRSGVKRYVGKVVVK